MTDILESEIKEDAFYMTGEAALILGLSSRHVARLVDSGSFPNSRRKSPNPRSPRLISGRDLIAYLRDSTV